MTNGMVRRELVFTYDSEADAAYIYLVPEGPQRSIAQTRLADLRLDRAAITIDFDGDGAAAGIEILGASRVLPAGLLREH